MIKKLIEEVSKLCDKELDMANCDHPPVFNSDHEAWAVVKEEIDEAEYEIGHLSRQSELAWVNIKNDDRIVLNERLEGWIQNAKNLAAEAIQVAAMLQKWQNTIKCSNVKFSDDNFKFTPFGSIKKYIATSTGYDKDGNGM